MENYFTPQEISEKLKVDIRTVYRWIREGRLKAVKIGHFWRISESELNRLLQGGMNTRKGE
ncbi:MAG: helix-turn-helix domain-containing protein [Desulfofundulus sp.]